MIYKFAPQLLLRMPVKTPSDYVGEPQIFLNDQFFQAALKVATPTFYDLLARQQWQAANLNPKETLTLQKYINRYCFRPTPFGLFSSVTLVNWSKEKQEQPSEPSFKPFIRTAMPLQNKIAGYLLENELLIKEKYESNPSIYRVLNEYRFFRTALNDSENKRDYQLQSIAFSKVLKDLLTLCKKGCPKPEIIHQIVLSAGCTKFEAEDYTDFLIEAQLLFNVNRLTITGADYLAQIATDLSPGPIQAKLLDILERQKKEHVVIEPGLIERLENDLQSLLPATEPWPDQLSIILKREDPAEVLDPIYQEKITAALTALELLSPSRQSATMTSFINSFHQHFEGQTLPLLQALDPEAGIGYQHPEKDKNNPLLETLNIPYKTDTASGGSWTAAHSVLMESWLRVKSDKTVIQLRQEDLERLRTNATSEPLLGMSVLFRVSENKLFVETAGGINAPALLGRFTVADQVIADAARAMARQLEEDNPELIFAELLHLADPHIDNVNRRETIYNWELPITAASVLPSNQQLHLSDLYLKIINNRVMLFSEEHQKFVIPRLTSAYNHQLNKLPLFRFLVDLSYQYGRSSLGLDLRQYFPGLGHFPRVEYRDTILSLATWVISASQIAELDHETDRQPAIFKKLSDQLGLPQLFCLAEGDQELVFDGESRRDIVFFCQCIRQKKEVVIKEFLAQPVVKQYNACLLPAEPLALPSLKTPGRLPAKSQRKYVPGSEWLYLKVYAPRVGVNRLLLRLEPLFKKRYAGQKISQWFFIRYDDHAPHIRIRLKVHPASTAEILLAFKGKLEDRIRQHVIREFQIDVYSRELERYAAGGIENTEHFFCAGSELFLRFLRTAKTNTLISTPAFALYSTFIIVNAFLKNIEEQISFLLESYQLFLPEFTGSSIKVELDKKYRELSAGLTAAFGAADPSLLSGSPKAGRNFISSLEVIRQYTGHTAPPDYLRSMIHMHLNRIFTDDSRKQEMISYYLLYKYLLSLKGRHKSSVKTFSDLFSPDVRP